MTPALIMTLSSDDQVTPYLSKLTRVLSDRTPLNKRISDRAEVMVKKHITKAARSRHKTASVLGAKRTGYLEGKAALVEGTHDAGGSTITVVGDIFARASGPVKVAPKTKKFLAIPADKESYGKRPGEFSDLDVIRILAKGKTMLALVRPGRTDEGGKKRRKKVLFWLVKSVTLPHDPGLLPSAFEFQGAMEKGAQDFWRLDL